MIEHFLKKKGPNTEDFWSWTKKNETRGGGGTTGFFQVLQSRREVNISKEKHGGFIFFES